MRTAKPKSNPYEILAVSRSASIEEIKAAYRKAAKAHHPDRNGGSKASEVLFRGATEAKDELLDPIRRGALDRRLETEERRRVVARQGAKSTPAKATKPTSTPRDELSDILGRLGEERRRRQADLRKQQAERRERLAKTMRDAVAANRKTGAVRQPVKSPSKPFSSLAQEFTKSCPTGERVFWSVLGLIADAAVAAR